MQKIKKRSRWRGLAVSLLAFAAVIGLFLYVFGGTGAASDREQAALLERAIRNAAVSCYATEGRYPDTLRRIVDQYGVIVDESRFIVNYSVFAENVMPSITVIIKGESLT